MEISVIPMNEEFKTITDSVKIQACKTIPKCYFMTRQQIMNIKMKSKDPHFVELKFKVKNMIDS